MQLQQSERTGRSGRVSDKQSLMEGSVASELFRSAFDLRSPILDGYVLETCPGCWGQTPARRQSRFVVRSSGSPSIPDANWPESTVWSADRWSSVRTADRRVPRSDRTFPVSRSVCTPRRTRSRRIAASTSPETITETHRMPTSRISLRRDFRPADIRHFRSKRAALSGYSHLLISINSHRRR